MDKIQRLCKWLQSSGASFDKIELKPDGDGGFGAYTNCKTEKDECLASIPYNLAITENVALETLKDHLIQPLRGARIMCLFLVYERWVRGDSSFWSPYIDCLPKTFSTPFYYNDDELKFLKGTPTETAIAARLDKYKEDWKAVRSSIPTSMISDEQLSWENYLWSANVYSSRAFPSSLVPGLDAEGSHNEALFPLLDMLNHRPTQPITWDSTDSSIKFIFRDSFEAGEQVFNNYGPKSNQELLMSYGFCIPGNIQDLYHVKLNCSNAPEGLRKEKFIKDIGLFKLDHYIRAANLSENTILPMMRVMVMNDIELFYSEEEYSGHGQPDTNFISFRNELSVFSTLGQLLKSKETTILDIDSTILGGNNSQSKLHKSNIFTTGIKRILSSSLSKIDKTKISLLQAVKEMMSMNEVTSLLPRWLSKSGSEIKTPSLAEISEDVVDNLALNELISSVIISDESFEEDRTFSSAINTRDIDLDSALALFLLRCRYRKSSKWYGVIGQYKRLELTHIMPEDRIGKLKIKYDSLFPELSDSYPKLFSSSKFTLDNFMWAAQMTNLFNVHINIGEYSVYGLCLA
ncbi:hypothetical protein H4219_003186 [Mycoemilia scoparia]|uniref:SET domain-containing protein n=1 Tax=Mycoemilia scoparia TaxID=417184 RepID=A0A9W8DTB5_9FUNG|nr:hypothetical protein H4219_003186 [Mycoemilia scoparia]